MMVQDKGITGQIMEVINDMLIELMATIASLDQDKRVERIKQGLKNKRAANPEWKRAGKDKNAAMWEKVTTIMAKHPTMSAEDISKLAECGVATVYRIKKTLAGAQASKALSFDLRMLDTCTYPLDQTPRIDPIWSRVGHFRLCRRLTTDFGRYLRSDCACLRGHQTIQTDLRDFRPLNFRSVSDFQS